MKSELEKKLININKQLIRLTLQQERLERRRREVQEQIDNEGQVEVEAEGIIHYRIVKQAQTQRKKNPCNVRNHARGPRYRTATITGEAGYDGDVVPSIGDLVRIVNPKSGQPNEGSIQGFCADGKAKVRCSGNVIITRQIKNLRYRVFE